MQSEREREKFNSDRNSTFNCSYNEISRRIFPNEINLKRAISHLTVLVIPIDIINQTGREGIRELTIASVDRSTDHTVMSPFWILRTVEGEIGKVWPDPPPEETEIPGLDAEPRSAPSIPAAAIGGVFKVRRGLIRLSTARGFAKLPGARAARNRAAFDSNNDEEAAADICIR